MYTLDETRWMALELPIALYGRDQVLLHLFNLKSHVPADYAKQIEIDIVHLLDTDMDYDFISDFISDFQS
jgi:hypothetical protein